MYAHQAQSAMAQCKQQGLAFNKSLIWERLLTFVDYLDVISWAQHFTDVAKLQTISLFRDMLVYIMNCYQHIGSSE